MTGESPPPTLRWLSCEADQRRIARSYLRDPLVSGIEHLHEARDQGKRIVVAPVHLGNWEASW
jgi:lauroyl/myristoyl acyltransferase